MATALRPCHKNMARQYAISNKEKTFDIHQSAMDEYISYLLIQKNSFRLFGYKHAG
ncbi:hypothetical protein IGS61_01745 [Janthinobacterium sp. FW305-129]|uniref:hypothetical protein n=1 Tax=Janthinobacterium sp. FW305-129 TaxID=2775054 RepID=UPI001E2C7B68|nr:hypothetical protein [Janthinobacterium sp. FW305-129]MCC7596191.1 hypothetical protein [Janthinobacterium sp. FW305-129]